MMLPTPTNKPAVTKKRRTRKRAPGAPRRFKTAFIFFSITKHREIREELEKQGQSPKLMSTTTIAKMVSEAWKNLSKEERGTWDEIAAKDRARYEFEKQMYKGPWQVPKDYEGRDPMAPRRPCSAFVSFLQDKRDEVKVANPDASSNEIMRLVAQAWYESTERDRYLEEEAKRLAVYKKKMKEWRDKKQRNPDVVLATEREQKAWKALEMQEKGGVPTSGMVESFRADSPTEAASAFDACTALSAPLEDEMPTDEGTGYTYLVPSATTNIENERCGSDLHVLDQDASLMSLCGDDAGGDEFVAPPAPVARTTRPFALGTQQPRGGHQYREQMSDPQQWSRGSRLGTTPYAEPVVGVSPLVEPISMELGLLLLRRMRAENDVLQGLLARRRLASSQSALLGASALLHGSPNSLFL